MNNEVIDTWSIKLNVQKFNVYNDVSTGVRCRNFPCASLSSIKQYIQIFKHLQIKHNRNSVESGFKHNNLSSLFSHIWFPIILFTIVGILQYFKLFLYKIKTWHVKRRGFEIIYLCYLLFCCRDIKSTIM
jgi:hypothetical protein